MPKKIKRVKDKEAEPKPSETVLVLRTCAADGTSSHGFAWPTSGPVEALDWQNTEECGHGLHGWLWGCGDWSLKVKADKLLWLVVEVQKAVIVDLGGKVKFPKGVVVGSFGAWNDAMKFIRVRIPDEYHTVATGDSGHASAIGDYGHASAIGDYGHASATGDYGHASAAGYSGHASATGHSGHASATGEYGHASAAGDYGHASAAGYSGHASAIGDSGHASAIGDYGYASAAGDSGWSIAGYGGRVKASGNGALTALYFNEKDSRPRVVTAYVGENGIEADTWYALKDGQFVEADNA